ncbi:MAG: NAD(P)-dependent oxidoreductase [Pseudomonadales bacterium]|nr:NAD(P)-dependent oxidoreductase [Pseudomonadales bacterium]
MNFTVLGASGMIGRHLVSALQRRGERVFAPVRGDDTVFTRALGHVIYAIGLTADFRNRPYDTVEAHVSYLSQVLQRSRFDSLLYLSSTRVYAGADSTKEDTPLRVQPDNPSDLYNLSKLMGESLCHASSREGVRVARLSNVVGDDDPDSENFVSVLLREARTGHIVLRTALSSAKDYIHIDDAVEILLRIATSGCERVYNVASGRQTTNAEWGERLGEATGCTLEVAAEAVEYSFAPIDITRLRTEFGFVAKPAIDTVVRIPGV